MGTQNRIEWMDRAKGVGICLVVMAHTAISVRSLIYLFHMPLFFLLSGFLFNESRIKNYRLFVVDRACRIMVPYVLFFLISVPLSRIGSGLSLSSGDVFKAFFIPKVASPHPNPTLWFFSALFWVNLLYAGILYARNLAVRRLKIGNRAGASLALLLSTAITCIGCVFQGDESLPLSFVRSLYYVLFFAVGHWLRLYGLDLKVRVPSLAVDVVGVCCCASLGLLVVNPDAVGPIVGMNNSFLRHVTGICVAMALSWAVVWLCMKMAFAPCLSWLGTNSMIIFPLHIFTLEFFTYMMLGFGLTPKFSADAFCLAGSCFSLVALIPVVAFFSRNWPCVTGRWIPRFCERREKKDGRSVENQQEASA